MLLVVWLPSALAAAPLAKVHPLGHIRRTGEVAERLKAAVC